MSGEPIDRRLLLALVACCAIPMAAILVLTGVVGWTIGAAAALLLGVVAGAVCVAVMVHRHRPRRH